MRSDTTTERGVAVALLERLIHLRLPRVLKIKERVDRGERLGEVDVDFLEAALADSANAKPLIDHHPELEGIAVRMISLYHHITEKALANERSESSQS
jgi:hypothetical protein